MKKITILFSCAIVMTGAVSCSKKKKDEAGPSGNVASMLVGTKWRLTAQTINPAVDVTGDEVPDSDMFAFMPECAKDDYVVFSTGGVYQLFEGQKKCTETQEPPGNWVLYNSDKSLRVTDQDGSFEAEIVSITASELKFRYNEVMDGKNIQVTETRVKN
ncbi:lipocalin-like domain-containing protein [Chitinophaga rhizosphaerae]|uniref:lipocalin family protein n=1 Tax=Chitinophaga rhizosphaerae TaxID=1864947 RepID=UPI000F7FE411|nr:lipocalin family protein [Chitinophaga rhizosphaerae]